jgi:hypothetical protein
MVPYLLVFRGLAVCELARLLALHVQHLGPSHSRHIQTPTSSCEMCGSPDAQLYMLGCPRFGRTSVCDFSRSTSSCTVPSRSICRRHRGTETCFSSGEEAPSCLLDQAPWLARSNRLRRTSPAPLPGSRGATHIALCVYACVPWCTRRCAPV